MLLRSTLVYLPAVLLPRIATFVLVVVATRLLPISEYGLFALVTVVGEAAEGIATNWIRIALVRLSGGAPMIPAALWRRMARANVIAIAVAIVIVLPAALVFEPERWAAFWIAVAAYVAAISTLRFGLNVLQATARRATYAAIEAGRAAAIFVAPVAAVLLVRGVRRDCPHRRATPDRRSPICRPPPSCRL